jgi:hypothetical protein
MMLRIILGIVIIAAVIQAGVFVSDYFNKSFAADALKSQIQNENQNMELLSAKIQELNTEIAGNTANVNKIMNAIAGESQYIPSERINSNEMVRELLELGQKNSVSVIPLTTQDWSEVKTPENDHQVLKMTLEILGTPEHITQFVGGLPELNNTLIIESIALAQNIEIPAAEITPPTAANFSHVEQFKANIALAVYAK